MKLNNREKFLISLACMLFIFLSIINFILVPSYKKYVEQIELQDSLIFEIDSLNLKKNSLNAQKDIYLRTLELNNEKEKIFTKYIEDDIIETMFMQMSRDINFKIIDFYSKTYDTIDVLESDILNGNKITVKEIKLGLLGNVEVLNTFLSKFENIAYITLNNIDYNSNENNDITKLYVTYLVFMRDRDTNEIEKVE